MQRLINFKETIPMDSKIKKNFLLFLLLLMALSFLGCGYALVGRASNLPEDIRTLAMIPLVNSTDRSEVEQILSLAIIEELVTRKRFELVDTKAGADAVIEGEVSQFFVDPISFDDEGRATEYEVRIVTKIKFEDLIREEILWESDRYTFRETYPVEDAEADYFDQERDAIEEVAEKMARSLVSDLLERF